MTLEGLHQLHILLFVLVIVHVVYSVMIMALGMWKASVNIFWEAYICNLFFSDEFMQPNFVGFAMEVLGRKVLDGRVFKCTWYVFSFNASNG